MTWFLHKIEDAFEALVNKAVTILGHSLTFFAAFVFVLVWLFDKESYQQSRHDFLRDLMYALTFLCFFIIQKSVNHFSKTIQIKLNELVASHENARTHLIDIENKSERELEKLAKDYSTLAQESLKKDEEELEASKE